jgi:hypothetical protein
MAGNVISLRNGLAGVGIQDMAGAREDERSVKPLLLGLALLFGLGCSPQGGGTPITCAQGDTIDGHVVLARVAEPDSGSPVNFWRAEICVDRCFTVFATCSVIDPEHSAVCTHAGLGSYGINFDAADSYATASLQVFGCGGTVEYQTSKPSGGAHENPNTHCRRTSTLFGFDFQEIPSCDTPSDASVTDALSTDAPPGATDASSG